MEIECGEHFFGKVGEAYYRSHPNPPIEIHLQCQRCGFVKIIPPDEIKEYKLYGQQHIIPNHLRDF